MTTDEMQTIRGAIQAALKAGHSFAKSGKCRDIDPRKAAHDATTTIRTSLNDSLAGVIGEVTEG